MHIGLLAAMPEELGQILDNIEIIETNKFGDLEIFSGIWINQNKKKFYYQLLGVAGVKSALQERQRD